MHGNNELILANTQNTQPTVKDGENEELLKRIRAAEEIVRREREVARLKNQKEFTLKNRWAYHKAIAVVCEKYSGLDKDVVAKFSYEDKECLGDSIENKARKSCRRETYLKWLHFFVAFGAICSLAYFVHRTWLFSLILVPVWVPMWGDMQVHDFLNYRAQTKKEDRISLPDEVKQNAEGGENERE